MKSTINYMIKNKAAKSRAKSAEKKEALRGEIFAKTGWMPSKSLSMKQMKLAITNS